MVTREADRAGAPGCVASLVPKAYGGSGHGWRCELSGLPVPRQEAGEFMVLHPARDDLLEHVLQVGEGIDAVHLAALCRTPNYAEAASACRSRPEVEIRRFGIV